MHRRLLRIAQGILVQCLCGAILFGCGRSNTDVSKTSVSRSVSSSAPNPSSSTASSTSYAPSPTTDVSSPTTSNSAPSSMTFLSEPADGVTPWLRVISSASSQILINEYLLTDQALISALVTAARRGVKVDVIVDGHPYKDPTALSQCQSAFAGTGVVLRTAPARFEGSYSFDHAKYIVVDPGKKDQVAILGSPNATISAFDGSNAEDAVMTTDPQVVSDLGDLFSADWSGDLAGYNPRQNLVVSPGSTSALVDMIDLSGPVEIATEELGDVPLIYGAIESHAGTARVLLPSYLSYSEQSYALQLERAGVQVRTLSSVYLHAKLIVTSSETFVGSQNFSYPSMMNNREVGIISTNGAIRDQALSWFNSMWNNAVSLQAQVTTSMASTSGTLGPTTTAPAPSVATSSYPYIPYGASESQVESLWGRPFSTGTVVYDGYPELTWSYPGGTVYFGSGDTVVHVTRAAS